MLNYFDYWWQLFYEFIEYLVALAYDCPTDYCAQAGFVGNSSICRIHGGLSTAPLWVVYGDFATRYKII